MKILVATDGTLDRVQAADAVARWHDEGDEVLVFTAMNVPTEFLRGLGNSGVSAAAQIAHEAGQTLGAGDRAAERLVDSMKSTSQAKTDSPVLHAMAAAANDRVRPIVTELHSRGIEAKTAWRSTEGKTANTILAKAKDFEADVVIIGSHGRGQFEGRLGSTGTKIVRLCDASVVVLRMPTGGTNANAD